MFVCLFNLLPYINIFVMLKSGVGALMIQVNCQLGVGLSFKYEDTVVSNPSINSSVMPITMNFPSMLHQGDNVDLLSR